MIPPGFGQGSWIRPRDGPLPPMSCEEVAVVSTVRFAVRAALACLALGAVAGRPAPAVAQGNRPPTGVVYVQSNDPTPGQNAILGYRVNPANGQLSPLPGSPYATRGTGLGNP